MIDVKMRLDNLEADLASDYSSIAFRSDLETVAGELFGRNRKYEAFNLLTCYGRLMECGKNKKAKIIESMLLFIKDARQVLI
jgi:hypothetical protein